MDQDEDLQALSRTMRRACLQVQRSIDIFTGRPPSTHRQLDVAAYEWYFRFLYHRLRRLRNKVGPINRYDIDTLLEHYAYYPKHFGRAAALQKEMAEKPGLRETARAAPVDDDRLKVEGPGFLKWSISSIGQRDHSPRKAGRSRGRGRRSRSEP